MQGVIGAIAVSSALWMYFDARGFDYDKKDVRGLGAIGPVGWFFSGLFLWIVAIPAYFVTRPQLRRAGDVRRSGISFDGAARQERSTLEPIALASISALLLVVLVSSALQGLVTSLIPACDSEPVRGLALQALQQNIPDVSLASFGEVSADTTKDRRACRVQASSAAFTGSAWLNFTIDRHGSDQIFVQFKQ